MKKEKTSIKLELQKALENNIMVTHTYLSKTVGISLHRVKKYCKNHNIDVSNYNYETLSKKNNEKIINEKIINEKIINEQIAKENKRKLKMGEIKKQKIILNPPKEIKIKL